MELISAGKAGLREKINGVIRKLEVPRAELGNIRARLLERKKTLFNSVVRALEKKDKSRALIYANEQAELNKLLNLITVGELAITQISLRLESLRDLGDIITHTNTALVAVKRVEKDVGDLMSYMGSMEGEFDETFNGFMAQMKGVIPSVHLNLQTQDGEEIVKEAEEYLRMEELEKELPSTEGMGEVGIEVA